MKLGIVGLGVVGSALEHGFKRLGHEVKAHDRKLHTNIRDLFGADVIFVCVPTPSMPDGSCDTSIVESVVAELQSYSGIVAIKSTVTPGTTERLTARYQIKLCHCPEFLRMESPKVDLVENHKCLVVGTHDKKVFDTIVACFGHYPKATVQLHPTESELVKYFHNSLNALRIMFADSYWQLCQALGVDYMAVKNAAVLTTGVPNQYMDVSRVFRGYGLACLPKDVEAIWKFAASKGVPFNLIKAVHEENEIIKKG